MTNGSDLSDESGERTVYTDRTEVRRWANENDAVPVRHDTDEEAPPDLVRRDEMREHHREHDWDEFLREFDKLELALVHDPGSGGGHRLVPRADLSEERWTADDAVAEELLEGGTVETEVTEREVVETEVVEEATIESEVVGSEVVHSEVVDTEVVDEEIVDMWVVDETEAAVTDADGRTPLNGGQRIEIEERGGVVLDIDEERAEIVEEIEETVIESRVLDRDVEETTRSGEESIDIDIDVAGVHEHIEGSGLVDTDADAVIGERHIRTEFEEDDRATSTISEARTVENRIAERKTVLAGIDDVDIGDRRVVSETVLDTEVLESEADRRAGLDDDRHAGDGPSTGEATASGTAGESMADETTDEPTAGGATADGTVTDQEMSGGTGSTDPEPSGTAPGRTSRTDASPTERRTTASGTAGEEPPIDWEGSKGTSERLMGRDVETVEGETIGIVSDIDENDRLIYVDEDPGLTDRLKANLRWGDDEDALVLTDDHVRGLEAGRIVVSAHQSST